MPRLRPILQWLLFVALVPRLLHAAPGEPQAPVAQDPRAGYLIDLQLRASTLTAVSVADITNYIENKHIRSDDDWRVLLLDAAGQPIGMRLIDNPYRFSPRFGDEQVLPLTIKVPAVPALAAVAIQDQRQQERLRIPIDNAFRGRAAAARARFLAHDGENRRLIREAAARRATERGKGQAAAPASRAIHLDALPRELRDRVIADTAEEMEALLRFGPDTLNAAHTLSLAPEQVALADARPGGAPGGRRGAERRVGRPLHRDGPRHRREHRGSRLSTPLLPLTNTPPRRGSSGRHSCTPTRPADTRAESPQATSRSAGRSWTGTSWASGGRR